MKKLLLLAASLAVFSMANALTYSVTVPAGTKACYIAGTMNEWSQEAMTKVTETTYTIDIATATEDDVYKYCSGPGWSYVEQTASGGDVADRTYSASDEVEKWAAIYDPGVVVEYVNITVAINYGYQPTIWWWGAGDQCKDAQDMGYSWPGPEMETAAVDGWYKWDFENVNKDLGVTFKIDGNEIGSQLKTTKSVCYDNTGSEITCPGGVITAADEAIANPATLVGVYNMIGQPVSADADGLKIFVYSDGTTEKKY